ncbi:predicted protein [Coccidioides posadasii C735 delta SOWgp]|uniref:Uncharacterized protein n=1 Tax=Coccidioides posadasii (strain C735) TaxID=222929 RepID=C5P3B4_COCP7|nr:predicted protein [Coccidioides posadasii C735 delta SOWgp]EER28802.1 predicted protein [Coccidioides posadasii C735 delta SOWgp]|eukprot:XP_003070947.1 predicted protein [Coccidioides posadasii C735 delta SOWgp]
MWLPRYKLLGKDPRCLTSVPGGGRDGLGLSAGELSITTPYSIAERSFVTYRGRRLARFTNPPPKTQSAVQAVPRLQGRLPSPCPKGPKNKFDTAGAEHGNVLARHDHPHLGRPWIKVVKGGGGNRRSATRLGLEEKAKRTQKQDRGPQHYEDDSSFYPIGYEFLW